MLDATHVCAALFPLLFKTDSYCHSIGPAPRKSKYLCSLQAGASRALKLCFLPEYMALERRVNKGMNIGGQLPARGRAYQVLWNGCHFWGWMLRHFISGWSLSKSSSGWQEHISKYCFFWRAHLNWETCKEIPSNLSVSQGSTTELASGQWCAMLLPAWGSKSKECILVKVLKVLGMCPKNFREDQFLLLSQKVRSYTVNFIHRSQK